MERHQSGGATQASVGDRVVIQSRLLGQPTHESEVIEVGDKGDTPPYVVRWEDGGHETLFVPDSDAAVEHLEHPE